MSFNSTPFTQQSLNTVSTVNMSPEQMSSEQTYPGKGVGYDWRAVIAEVEAVLLDAELASLTESVKAD
ncbi:MAG: hypothetical protein NWQ68_08465 [Ilumatobacteraceae bacterium]|jgi:hypothetical protein|nr:hypothetical protein [Ilumatobacteraceae bacterium]